MIRFVAVFVVVSASLLASTQAEAGCRGGRCSLRSRSVQVQRGGRRLVKIEKKTERRRGLRRRSVEKSAE